MGLLSKHMTRTTLLAKNAKTDRRFRLAFDFISKNAYVAGRLYEAEVAE